MLLAAVTWIAGFLLLSGLFYLFVKNRNVAAIAVLVILAAHVYVRPTFFLLGLDLPHPYHVFGPTVPWNLVVLALTASIVWMLIFLVFHRFSFWNLAPLQSAFPATSFDIHPQRLLLITSVFTLTGAVFTLYVLAQSGSLAQFMFDVKVAKELTGAYALREVAVLSGVLSILGVLKATRDSPGPFRLAVTDGRLAFWVLFLINLFLIFSWGNRYSVAMLAGALLIGWHFQINRISLFKLGTVVLTGGIILLALRDFRFGAMEEVLGRELYRDYTFWSGVSLSLHLSQFDAFMLALRDAGSVFPFREGRDFINGLLSWVPRALYPDKETFHVGGWFRRVYEPNVINGWPITTIGSWFVNFGLVGIAFGAAVSGLIVGVMDRAYRNPHLSIWNAAVGSSVALLMLDGGIGTGFFQRIVLLLIPLYLILIFVQVRSVHASTSVLGIKR